MYLKSILFGLVEGLTSALPVSESGHRLLLESLLKKSAPALLPLGVALAIIIVFHKTLWQMILGLGGMFKKNFRWKKANRYQRMAVYALPAAIPYWILLYLQRTYGILEGIGFNLLGCGILFALTAGLLFIGDHSIDRRWGITDMKGGHLFKLALFQGASILPGFSRTAFTLCMARNMGFDKTDAMEFSFIMAVPALLGGELLTLDPAAIGPIGPWLAALAAATLAAIGGLLGVKALIKRDQLGWLLFYCLIAAVAAVVLNFVV